MWIQHNIRTALRKNKLRVDFRTYLVDPTKIMEVQSAAVRVPSFVAAAVQSNLDVLGVVSPDGSTNGQLVRDYVLKNQLDLWIVPGEEYLTKEGVRLCIYNVQKPLKPNLDVSSACKNAHDNNGFVMLCEAHPNTIKSADDIFGSPTSVDAIEIYCAKNRGYQYINTAHEIPQVITSGCSKPTDLSKSHIYTSIERSQLEGWGLLPEGYGKNFVPPYLQNIEERP